MRNNSKLSTVWKLLSWIYHDGLKQHTQKAIAFVVLSGAGVGMQLGAFICAAYYARALEHNKSFDRFGIYIESPRESLGLLITTALIIAITLISSAVLNYFARWLSLKLSIDYEKTCTQRILDISKDLPVIGNKFLNEIFSSPMMVRLAGSDARVCGKMLRTCLLSLFPATVVLLAGFILLYLNWMLTLFLMAIIPLGAFEYLNINKRTVKTSKSNETSRVVLGKTLRHYFTHAVPTVSEELKKIKKVYTDDYISRIMSGDQIRFLTQILTAISLCAVILFFGISGLQKGTSLTYFVLYLLILRYGMNNLLSLITIASNLSLHYSSLKRYHEFIMSKQQLDFAASQKIPTLSYYSLTDKQHNAPIKHLGPLVVLSSQPFSRQSFAPICGALEGDAPVTWPQLLQEVFICESVNQWVSDEACDKPYGKFLWYQNPKKDLSDFFALTIIKGKLCGGSYSEIFQAYQSAKIEQNKNWIDELFDDEEHDEE